jgi:hypothetical protein
MMATRFRFEHWCVKKDVAEGGSGAVENEPGTNKISNCGAFSNEFCPYYQYSHFKRFLT